MRFVFPITAALCFGNLAAIADTPSEVIAQQSDAQENQSVRSWIEMLDSPRFRDRAEASAMLSRLGIQAIDALEHATIHGTVEACDRAFEILKQHHDSEDATLQTAAAEALARMAAQTDHPKSKSAERLLQPETPTAQPPQPLRIPILPAPRAINRRVNIKIGVGNRDITVTENGTTIRLIENADGIQVERSDGKGGVVKSKFKNREELKEKDAEAYKALEKIPGGIQIQAGKKKKPDAIRREAIQNLQDTIKKHQEMRRQHEQLRQRLRTKPPTPPDVLPRTKPIDLDV